MIDGSKDRFHIFYDDPSLDKVPEFQLISWCGNFVKTHKLLKYWANHKKLRENCAFPQSFHTRK